jgi:hypothetical protein
MLDNISGNNIVGACDLHLPNPILWEVAMVVLLRNVMKGTDFGTLSLLPRWSIDVPLEHKCRVPLLLRIDLFGFQLHRL